MATTRATMIAIENLINFSIDEIMTKDNVNTMMINIFTDEEIVMGLMSNPLLIIKIEMGGEILGSQVGKDVTIPRII